MEQRISDLQQRISDLEYWIAVLDQRYLTHGVETSCPGVGVADIEQRISDL
jgi:hypothetical protein